MLLLWWRYIAIQSVPELSSLKRTYLKKKSRKYSTFETRTILLAGIKDQWDEDGGKILSGDNTCVGAVMLRPIRFKCFVAWISWLSLYYTYTHIIQLTMCILNFHSRKTRLAFPERNYRVRRGVCVVVDGRSSFANKSDTPPWLSRNVNRTG